MADTKEIDWFAKAYPDLTRDEIEDILDACDDLFNSDINWKLNDSDD